MGKDKTKNAEIKEEILQQDQSQDSGHDNTPKPKRKKGVIKKLVTLLLIILLCGIGYFFVVHIFIGGQGGQVKTITESTLVNVVKKAKLNAVEYPYSGYTKVEKDDKDLYYVRYKGSVKAGIDMEKVTVNLDEDNHVVRIMMPEIEIDEVNVDVNSLDTIFVDEKYNTENMGQELYKVAVNDMEKKVEENRAEIEKMTIDNSKRTLKALIEPWLNDVSLTEPYQIIVLSQGEQ